MIMGKKSMKMIDIKARKILFNTYWDKGWLSSKDKSLSKEDFEYAKSKGLMFDPLSIDHDTCVKEIIKVSKKIEDKKVFDAFLSSLSTRRLDWRSSIASYFFGVQIKSHKYTPVISGTSYEDGEPVHHSFCCEICRNMSWGIYSSEKYSNQDLSVLNFERLKWGGVRHGDLIYTLFDLQQFNNLKISIPTDEDISIFKNILQVVDTAQPNDYPGSLSKRLKDVLPSNKSERDILIDILACIGILLPKSFDRPLRNNWSDWKFIEYWKGEDKYNKDVVYSYFGKYLE